MIGFGFHNDAAGIANAEFHADEGARNVNGIALKEALLHFRAQGLIHLEPLLLCHRCEFRFQCVVASDYVDAFSNRRACHATFYDLCKTG